ncbi:MAG: tyrosine-type recombinase/integrase [Euzebya sp.]
MQLVKIYGIQKRTGDRVKLPHVVRYTIDGRHRSKSFRTNAEADRYRGALLRAVQAGDEFDEATSEPQSWQLPLSELGVHEWARRWLAEQWIEWQPRTRISAADALARFTALTVRPRSKTPKELRRYLTEAIAPDAQSLDDSLERWMDRNCLTLGDLDRQTVSAISRKLGLKVDGQSPLAANTAKRYRTNAHACVLAAVDAGAIPADPWPKRSKSRANRKATRVRRAVDVRSLPSPEQMAEALAAMRNDQPSSRTYQVMTSVAYYAGLRPSEIIMLRVGSLTLPDEGWGRIDVTEADIDFDEPGEPKTGPRSVPIPPVLVEMLAEWINDHAFASHRALLFRTRNDTRPSTPNWNRAWQRALDKVGHPPLRVYDCRHAAATTWLRAGVPLGETARRMGHSVETLVSTYVGALDGDEAIGNARIDAVLNEPAAVRHGRRTT